ncbi:hypothetical protein WG947_16165 [Pontibacter sp. H259]|uniref:hypothetical protein n=1 Tax=Pontibacter sp. H259 TaxID=3133421 RepID=UPI0030BB7DF3
MKSILKLLAFTALLLISKFTKEEKLITTPAESPQVIVSTVQNQLPVHTTSGDMPVVPVQPIIATEATIK